MDVVAPNVSLTVLTEKTPMTLSHSVPSFGFHPSSFASPRARKSTRSFTSRAEYSFPEIPHVKGANE